MGPTINRYFAVTGIISHLILIIGGAIVIYRYQASHDVTQQLSKVLYKISDLAAPLPDLSNSYRISPRFNTEPSQYPLFDPQGVPIAASSGAFIAPPHLPHHYCS